MCSTQRGGPAEKPERPQTETFSNWSDSDVTGHSRALPKGSPQAIYKGDTGARDPQFIVVFFLTEAAI